MTAEEFNATLAATGWSAAELARRLSLGSDRAVRRWASGQNPVPPPVALWLRQVAAAITALPPPE
jgi:hypothetical protein